MKPAIGLLLFLGTISLFAQSGPAPTEVEVLERANVLFIDGKATMPVAFHYLAVGFQLGRDHHHVSIAARLGNGGGKAEVDAYLMRALGPEASEADEVARTAFELSYPFDGWVDIFNDVELAKGKYWLVLAKPKEANWSSINWFAAQPASVRDACNAFLMDSQGFAFESDAAEYLPASKFEKKYTPYAYQIQVTELRPANAPETCNRTFTFGKDSSR